MKKRMERRILEWLVASVGNQYARRWLCPLKHDSQTQPQHQAGFAVTLSQINLFIGMSFPVAVGSPPARARGVFSGSSGRASQDQRGATLRNFASLASDGPSAAQVSVQNPLLTNPFLVACLNSASTGTPLTGQACAEMSSLEERASS